MAGSPLSNGASSRSNDLNAVQTDAMVRDEKKIFAQKATEEIEFTEDESELDEGHPNDLSVIEEEDDEEEDVDDEGVDVDEDEGADESGESGEISGEFEEG